MADNPIIATPQQLKGAFKAHSKISEGGSTIAHYLLKFYASECGLKAIFLLQHNLGNTSDFERKLQQRYGHKHDLQRWVDELKIPPRDLPNIRGDFSPIRQMHEKLRYGLEVSQAHKAYLDALHKILKQKLRQ